MNDPALERIRLEIHESMARDRERGLPVVVFHLSSFGQAQFLAPIILAMDGLETRFSLYMAHDSDMKGQDCGLPIPAPRWFPAALAPDLPLTDVFVQPEIYGRGPREAVRIFVGHGQPNKHTNWSDDNLRSFDWYFLYGELERSMFEVIRADKSEVTAHIRLMDIGYPKLDALIQGRYGREETLRGLGLSPERTTVLYAPAWDPGGALRTLGARVPEKILQGRDVNLIVKLHPASLEPKGSVYYDFYTGGVDWLKVMTGIGGEMGVGDNYRYIHDFSIDPYLAAADVLVTDFSGVALEYMTQDRPVVYLHCPEFYQKTLVEWESDPDMAINDDRFNAGRNAGVVARDLDDLPRALDTALADPPELARRRRRLIKRFLYNPGHGAEHAARAIERACRDRGRGNHGPGGMEG